MSHERQSLLQMLSKLRYLLPRQQMFSHCGLKPSLKPRLTKFPAPAIRCFNKWYREPRSKRSKLNWKISPEIPKEGSSTKTRASNLRKRINRWLSRKKADACVNQPGRGRGRCQVLAKNQSQWTKNENPAMSFIMDSVLINLKRIATLLQSKKTRAKEKMSKAEILKATSC